MKRLSLIPMPGNEASAADLAALLKGEVCPLTVHTFPDTETAISFETKPQENSALICTLDRPNEKFLPLTFAARTARELGAQRVGLVAPYLAYMRQDTRFTAGTAVSARLFAGELSKTFDWIVTVDPHLHRIRRLEDIFNVPAKKAHAAPAIAAWIRQHVSDPIIVGPDSESSQWIREVAQSCNAPFFALKKTRVSDHDVVIALDRDIARAGQPVLVDDIVSTGETMAQAIQLLHTKFSERAICIAVHAVFSAGAYDRLEKAGAKKVVTTNTISHSTNAIDIRDALSAGMAACV